MAVDLKVPDMGESVTEVYIGQWQKKEGDRVEQDDALVEIESEKATLDLRAPAAGVLTKIMKSQGEAADVGEVIGQIDESDGKGKADASAPEKRSETKANTEEKKGPAKQTEQVVSEPAKVEAEPLAKREASQAPKSQGISEGESTKPSEPTAKAAEPAATAEAAAASTADRREPPAAKALEAYATKEPPASERSEDRVPMSPIRRRIAQRLVDAQSNAALLTTFNEIDMSAIKQLRGQLGEAFHKRYGVKLGFMSFFVKAAIEALRQCPELNAIIDGNDIVYRRYYDVGVAISSDKGLVVPILRDADHMGFAAIEQAIGDLSQRARSGELKVDELQGGTFTITNGGVFGSLMSTPIVNPPQSGVLGMHAIQDRPIAVAGQVVIRPMMYVALTYDHRIVDGREAVTFLRRIKETIEEPARLLIEV